VQTFVDGSQGARRATLEHHNDGGHCQPRMAGKVYGLLEGLFVESCPACGASSTGGFCGICAHGLRRVPNPCPRCGLERPVGRCPRAPVAWDVDAVVAPFAYASPLDHYLRALKYRGARSLGRAFALLLAPLLRDACAHVDALVAVPLHRTRLRERGYNQAQEIARVLGRALGVPALERGIERRLPTPPQTGHNALERQAGVARAFQVERELRGLRIAIVDDVVTTGATVNALAAELKARGAVRCVAFAVARTPEPRHGQNV
jgi:ComF family protein